MKQQRPWGFLPDIFNRIPITKWDYTGTLSFEDRATTVLDFNISRFTSNHFVMQINDLESDYSSLIDTKTQNNLNKLELLGIDRSAILQLEILEPINSLFRTYRDYIKGCSGNLLIDMSCMPKRMLFPIIKLALESKNINNIVIGYTVPDSYTTSKLAEDTEPIKNFPGMGYEESARDEPQVIIVGLGYLQIDLGELKQQLTGDAPVRVLFPFPPGAPSYQRNWKLLLSLYNEEDPRTIPEPIRVDARDPSYTFDVIQELTNYGNSKAYLLPFGPKPHSLAMVLSAIKHHRHELYYAQPKIYHPDYSIGVKNVNGYPQHYGYCIKLNGINLYD